MSLPGLSVLNSLFGAGVRSRNALYERGILRAHRLRGPVVSVGNLSVGGSGKTPFVILLGKLLKERGIKFDILSRGYGRQTKGVAVVDPNGSASEFGDEPLLMARHLGVPVVLGEDRYQAGVLAESKFGAQMHILDDGFQHRALAREFDIVLLTPEDANDLLLPGGRLREPISSLRRADSVVLMGGASLKRLPHEDIFVWSASRGILSQHIPQRPVAFCGIARPQNFFQQLRAAGIEPVAEAVYRDHHAYTESDIQELQELCRTGEGAGYITTEKDEINLGEHLVKLQPLTVVPVQMKLANAPNAVDTLLRVIECRKRLS
jgi:tetraacyldisaccharide 4'-kinase